MLSTELLLLNVEEVRRRSLLVWRGIPADRLKWGTRRSRDDMPRIG